MSNSEASEYNTVNFDFVSVARLVWIRKWRLFVGGLVGLGLAVSISFLLAPRYQAEGNLIVRSDALTAADTDRAFASTAVNEAVVTTEQDVLTSEGLLRRVAEQVEIPPDELMGTTQSLRALLPPAIITKLKDVLKFAEPSDDGVLEQRIRFLRRSISVVPTKGSSLITIRAVAHTPQLSSAIVNSVMQLYMRDRTDQETNAANSIELALRERLKQTRQQIDRAEAQLVQMLQKPGAIENSEVPGLMQRMTLIISKLIDARAELSRRQAEYDSAVALRDGKNGPDANSDVVGRLRSELGILQAKTAGSMAVSGPAYLRAQLAEIQALREEIAAEVNRTVVSRAAAVTAALSTVKSLQKQAADEGADRQQQSSTAIGLSGLRETVASLWRTSDTLENRLIDLAAHPSSQNAHILGPAFPPTLPSFPNKPLFAVAGFLIGCVGTAIGVLFVVHLGNRRPLAVQFAQIMHAPLLGGVPELGQRRGQRRLVASAIETRQNKDGLADTLYAVALELEDQVREKKLGSVTITSAHSGEGKTTVATALSRVLASMSLRVLLIDLDLRKPSVERVAMAGARKMVSEQQTLGDGHVIDAQVDSQSGLHIVTPFRQNGCPDPRGYLRSPELKAILTAAREKYDLLVFDTPPMLAVPDALMVAKLSDGIVLVAELDRSSSHEAAEVQRRLANTKARICGIVLTKVTADKGMSGVFTGYNSNYGFHDSFAQSEEA